MIANAEIVYFEASGDWYWSVRVSRGRTVTVDGVEDEYEDALEQVRDELEELVDGIEVEP